MAQKKNNGDGNRTPERKDPNQDVQPWLGWIAAAMVVLIVVVAVAMGLERSNRSDELDAEVGMTPIVGGMTVAMATEPADDTAQVDESGIVTVVMSVSTTEDVTATEAAADDRATGAVTETAALTQTTVLTATEAVTETDGAIDATGAVTPTDALTATVSAPVSAPVSATESEATATPEPTLTPVPSPTPRPSPSPTPTRGGPPPAFEVGDIVVNDVDAVALYSDTTLDALVLDTINAGVAMTVIEPSGPDLTYPVESGGYGWVRVRSTDGLVGWAITDGLGRVP